MGMGEILVVLAVVCFDVACRIVEIGLQMLAAGGLRGEVQNLPAACVDEASSFRADFLQKDLGLSVQVRIAVVWRNLVKIVDLVGCVFGKNVEGLRFIQALTTAATCSVRSRPADSSSAPASLPRVAVRAAS